MKKTSFNFMLILLFLHLSQTGFSQDMKSVGLRGGVTSGITLRSFLSDEVSFKMIGSCRDRGAVLTALMEYNEPAGIPNLDQVHLYYGFGGHVGYYRGYNRYRVPDGKGDFFTYYDWMALPAIGVDGIIGLEYRLNILPFSVAVDYKPFINIFGPYRMIFRDFSDVGLSVSYNFQK